MPRDEATLLDILTAAQLAVQFRGDLTKDEFRKDLKTRAAVLHQLLIIGEAVKRLSAEFRTEHPEIPWKSVAGMRDQLIHAYDRVDLDEVWTTLTRDLPHLVSVVEPLAPQPEELIAPEERSESESAT